MHSCRLLAFLSLSPVLTACAASLRVGGGASRVAPSGTRRPTKEVGGEGRGPTPAGSTRSGGGSASEPPESSALDRQGKVPALGFGSDGVELLPADRGLSGCLAGDAQGATDLSPTGSLGACCVDHETRSGVEGFSGVSQSLEVLHRALWAALHGVEGTGGPAGPPPGDRACLGAHDNASCHRFRAAGEGRRQLTLTNSNSHGISACNLLAPNLAGGGVGASSGAGFLISSYISRQRLPHGVPRVALTTEKNDPREVAASGGQITSQDK